MLYISLYIYIAILCYVDAYAKNKTSLLMLQTLFIAALYTLSIVKWETGGDWVPYVSYFQDNVDFHDFMSNFEVGYGVVSYLSKNILNSYSFFMFVFGSLIFSVIYYCVRQEYFNSNRSLLILLFYCYFTGFIFFQRQSFAIAICFLSIIFIIKEDKYKFILSVLFASLFHTSALIFLIAYPVSFIRTSKKHLLFAGLISISLYILIKFNTEIIYNFTSLLPIEHIASRVGEYVELSDLEANFSGNSDFGNLTGIARKVFVLAILTAFIGKLNKDNMLFTKMYNIAVAGAFFYISFGLIVQPLKRLSAYFDLAEMIALIIVAGSVKQKTKRFLLLNIIMAYAGLKLFSQIYSYYDLYIPFNTIFDIKIDRELY